MFVSGILFQPTNLNKKSIGSPHFHIFFFPNCLRFPVRAFRTAVQPCPFRLIRHLRFLLFNLGIKQPATTHHRAVAGV